MMNSKKSGPSPFFKDNLDCWRKNLLKIAILMTILIPWNVRGEKVFSGRKPKTMSQKLYDELFEDYNADLRPTRNESGSISVSMHLWFKQVLKVDEIDQILTIYCWTETYWVDELLAWNPEDFDGITTLRVPSHRIWRPDILVYNNADMNINENEISTNAVLNYTGHITNFRAIITKVTCNLEMTYFPFDQQTCDMMFASWSYDGSKVWIYPARDKQSNFLEYYIENTEWKLLNFSFQRNVNYYDCCPEPYPDITYRFVLERNPSYYILNLIIPSVFITVVTMVGFFTPYSSTGENTEKVSLGVTALLSLAIILLMVADKMPATSKVIPLIGKYYIGLIWLIFAATIITTVTLRLQSKGNAGKPLSAETKRLFFHYIARILFMKVDLPPKSFAPSSPSSTNQTNRGDNRAKNQQQPAFNRLSNGVVATETGVRFTTEDGTEGRFQKEEEGKEEEESEGYVVDNLDSEGITDHRQNYSNVVMVESRPVQHIFQRSASHNSLMLISEMEEDDESDDEDDGGGVQDARVSATRNKDSYVGGRSALRPLRRFDDMLDTSTGDRHFQQQEKLSNASSMIFGLNHNNNNNNHNNPPPPPQQQLQYRAFNNRPLLTTSITNNNINNKYSNNQSSPTQQQLPFDYPRCPHQRHNNNNNNNNNNNDNNLDTFQIKLSSSSCCPHQKRQQQSLPTKTSSCPASFDGDLGLAEVICSSSLSSEMLVRQVARLKLIVRAIDNKLEAELEMNSVRKEWEQLSRVCERMLMIIFVFITVLFAVLMLHSPGGSGSTASSSGQATSSAPPKPV